MPAYRYEAVDALGSSSKGILHAESPRAARSDLRSRGLVPLVIDLITGESNAQRNSLAHWFGDKLSTTELALFTRQLASLLEAKLPLEQAFSALMEQAERPYVRDLIASVRAEVMGVRHCRTRCCVIHVILPISIARWWPPVSISDNSLVSSRGSQILSNVAMRWYKKYGSRLLIRRSSLLSLLRS